jgi:hypothetical protein
VIYPPDLQKRSTDFLLRPIPPELQPHYVSGSLSDIIITLCSKDEPLDPELANLASISSLDYDQAIEEATTKELKTYYIECQQLLRDIAAFSATNT